MRRVVLGLGALGLLIGLGLGLHRVATLAGEEVDRTGDPVPVTVPGDEPLVRATLREGQRALFELCSEDRFARGWDQTAFEVWHLGDGERAQRVEPSVWRERVVGNSMGYACVVAVTWDSVLVDGEYGLRVAGDPAAVEGRMTGRIVGWRTLGGTDRGAVFAVFLGGLLLLLGLALPKKADPFAESEGEPVTDRGWVTRPAALRVTVAIVVLMLAMVGLSTLGGTFLGLVRALGLAVVEVALAVGFVAVAGRRGAALGLVKPRPGWWIVVLAPVVGALLWIAGAWLSRLVPSTGISPVEVFVGRPSGSLALAVVAVVVPIAEELFFRGFVFGALRERHGVSVATAVTVVVFALVHLPQQWGAWGPFAAVTFTGLVLTGLRAGTKSTFVPAVAHLTHNGLITFLALAAQG